MTKTLTVLMATMACMSWTASANENEATVRKAIASLSGEANQINQVQYFFTGNGCSAMIRTSVSDEPDMPSFLEVAVTEKNGAVASATIAGYSPEARRKPLLRTEAGANVFKLIKAERGQLKQIDKTEIRILSDAREAKIKNARLVSSYKTKGSAYQNSFSCSDMVFDASLTNKDVTTFINLVQSKLSAEQKFGAWEGCTPTAQTGYIEWTCGFSLDGASDYEQTATIFTKTDGTITVEKVGRK